MQEFIGAFRQIISLRVSEIPEDGRKHQQPKKAGGKKGNIQRMRQGEEDSDGEEGRSVSYNDTSNIYQIHKILTSDSYTLGRNVTSYLEGFHQ